jgi:hypothetical protein
MADYLITVMANNRLEQKGLLKRFNINCYGKEMTIHEIRANKAKIYKELKHDINSREYNEHFFKYVPDKSVPDKSVPKKTYKKRPSFLNKKTRKRRSGAFFNKFF